MREEGRASITRLFSPQQQYHSLPNCRIPCPRPATSPPQRQMSLCRSVHLSVRRSGQVQLHDGKDLAVFVIFAVVMRSIKGLVVAMRVLIGDVRP